MFTFHSDSHFFMLVYELPEEDYVLTEWTNLQRLSSIPVGGKQFLYQ